jgi:glutamine amidotransferase
MGKQVAIIDYQLGNMFSVQQACEFLGYEATITTDKNTILQADYAILPGVGAFWDAMLNLQSLDLVNVIKDYIASSKPLWEFVLDCSYCLQKAKSLEIQRPECN